MGPWIVTKGEIPDPHNLGISLRVNGVTKQDSSIRYMVYSIPEIIEFVSSHMTLEAGDVIATGTPSGVGASHGQYLKAGDTVEVEIQSVGVPMNEVAEETHP